MSIRLTTTRVPEDHTTRSSDKSTLVGYILHVQQLHDVPAKKSNKPQRYCSLLSWCSLSGRSPLIITPARKISLRDSLLNSVDNGKAILVVAELSSSSKFDVFERFVVYYCGLFNLSLSLTRYSFGHQLFHSSPLILEVNGLDCTVGHSVSIPDLGLDHD